MLIYSDRHFRDDPLTAVAQFPRARGGQDPAARTRRQIGAGEGGDEVRVGMRTGNDCVPFVAIFFRNLKREKFEYLIYRILYFTLLLMTVGRK